MKTLAIAVVLAALTACSQSERATEPAKTAAATFPLPPGVYEYTRSDGLRGINTIAADGTFSNARSDGIVETGTWAEENGQSCLTPDGQGDARRCYVFKRQNTEGKFTGTATDGATLEVRRID